MGPNTASSSAESNTTVSTGPDDVSAFPNPSTPNHSDGTHGISIIVGAVVGSFTAILIGGAAAFFMQRRRITKTEERRDTVTVKPYREPPSPLVTRSSLEANATPNNTNIQNAVQARAHGHALPHIIAELTDLLASLPTMISVYEPPPRYEEDTGSQVESGRL
ncbi:hypothetical protein EIP86_003961 [Pleurotus ostreatoroseus]|nr:hypothetical protein EIP86_003961 [Pleurotus ostreatoroseus]